MNHSSIKVGVITDQTGPLSFAGIANANVARMVIEWNPTMLRACGEDCAVFLSWLLEQGFKILEITPPHGNLRPVDPERLLAENQMTELLLAR